MNPSGISPYGYRIVVKLKFVEEETKGGIIIAPEIQEQDQLRTTKATLVAKGKLAFHSLQGVQYANPEIGQALKVKQYAGETFEGDDGEKYVLMNDIDVHGELEKL